MLPRRGAHHGAESACYACSNGRRPSLIGSLSGFRELDVTVAGKLEIISHVCSRGTRL